MAAKADIIVAVRGTNELNRLKTSLEQTSLSIQNINKTLVKGNFLDFLANSTGNVVRNIDNLQRNLALATQNLNSVALGTNGATTAAEQFIKANNAVNAGLREQQQLIRSVIQRDAAKFQAMQPPTPKALPAFQERGLQRLERTASKRSRFEEKTVQEIQRQVREGVLVENGLKRINLTLEERVRIAQKDGAIRKQNMIRANKLEMAERRINKATKERQAGERRGGGFSGGPGLSGAILGGGFPALFGGGPGTIIGGAVGGGFGGFSGGIAGSLIGRQVDSFVQSAREVGDALKDPQAALDKFSELGLKVSSSTQAQIKSLIDLGKVTEAQKLANSELAKVITSKGVESLLELDTGFDELQQASAKLFLKISSELAPAFTVLINLATRFVNSIAGPETQRAAANLDPKAFQDAQKQAASKARKGVPAFFPGVGDKKVYEQELTKLSREIVKNSTDKFNLTSPGEDGSGSGTGTVSKKSRFSKQELDILNKRIDRAKILGDLDNQAVFKAEQAIIFAKMRLDVAKAQGDENLIAIAAKERDLSLLELNNKKLDIARTKAEQLNDAFEKISQSIRNDIKNGIAGLIKGTSTLGDMLNNIANKFLDLALNNALFGNSFGDKVTGGLFKFLGFARGGRPPVGKPSIVGEKGPELFVPRSSGTIVPNNKLGGGGTNNVVVNVDASGSDVQGDDAGGQELGTLIAVAVQGELVKQQRPGGLLNR